MVSKAGTGASDSAKSVARLAYSKPSDPSQHFEMHLGGRERQEDQKFRAILRYIVSLRLAWAT